MATLRLCFLGDSVTVGTGDGLCRGWTSYLCEAEMARGHDISLYNLGVRAETSEDVARRWRDETTPRLPPHVDGRLIFMFGLNDCADFNGAGIRVPLDRSVTAARTMLSQAAAERRAIWIGMTPVRRDPPVISPGPGVTFTFDRARTMALNTAYREIAAELGLPYIDLHESLAEDPAWDQVLEDGDGVHPTETGHRRMAGIVEAHPAWRAWFDA